MRSNRCGPDGI